MRTASRFEHLREGFLSIHSFAVLLLEKLLCQIDTIAARYIYCRIRTRQDAAAPVCRAALPGAGRQRPGAVWLLRPYVWWRPTATASAAGRTERLRSLPSQLREMFVSIRHIP